MTHPPDWYVTPSSHVAQGVHTLSWPSSSTDPEMQGDVWKVPAGQAEHGAQEESIVTLQVAV